MISFGSDHVLRASVDNKLNDEDIDQLLNRSVQKEEDFKVQLELEMKNHEEKDVRLKASKHVMSNFDLSVETGTRACEFDGHLLINIHQSFIYIEDMSLFHSSLKMSRLYVLQVKHISVLNLQDQFPSLKF